jgi:hypothetical protein
VSIYKRWNGRVSKLRSKSVMLHYVHNIMQRAETQVWYSPDHVAESAGGYRHVFKANAS